MALARFERWLNAWGYPSAQGGLHRLPEQVPATHPYRREIADLLDPEGGIRAEAVFDVDGVPTVCFLTEQGDELADSTAFDEICQKIWNQNLISIALTIGEDRAVARPIVRGARECVELRYQDASTFSAFSRADVQSGEVFNARPDWFAAESRVDHELLANLHLMVTDLESYGMDKKDAQLLMAQTMFVAYLEHRGIAGDTYRTERVVSSLFDLVESGDRDGLAKLLTVLKRDFNGDLLGEREEYEPLWRELSDEALNRLNQFLQRVTLATGQQSFWNYDFRFIPVELLSGIYESFLGDDKEDVGAYYTPRHLAMLVADRVLSASADLLKERIYDGACGSGILLTTAYRRLLSQFEGQRGNAPSFEMRIDILRNSIFGSDLSLAACRVTAFSLYLSVLEGLKPADIAVLSDQGKAQLPKLLGKNLLAGKGEGDFFSKDNKHAKSGSFTIFLSNPPWVEPKGGVELSSDAWAETVGIKIPRRNTAGAFLMRALQATTPGARLCFILPVSLLGASTSREFVSRVLERYRVETLINFGDMRKLLFAGARQPCLVLVATPRKEEEGKPIPTELIEYWVPKADVSMAFGRLTLHTVDRHWIRAQTLAHDNEIITSLFWGNPFDLALVSRLRARGTLGDILKSREGWKTHKGFHAIDNAVENPRSSASLWKYPYLNAKRFALNGPLLDGAALEAFPKDRIPTVANLTPTMMSLFRGPRIVFTDGVTPEREIKAGFTDSHFSFNSSSGVIWAPSKDEDLLRFLAAYLHSDLVRYLLILTAYQMSFERERVTLKDLKGLPFLTPEQHHDPKRAILIVREVAKKLRSMEHRQFLQPMSDRRIWTETTDPLVAEYFGLTARDIDRIGEITESVLDSIQPNSFAGLRTPLQRKPKVEDVEAYGRTLASELSAWREALQGEGGIKTTLTYGERASHGALGIVRLDPVGKKRSRGEVELQRSDAAVIALLSKLSSMQALPMRIQENFYLASDMVIRQGDVMYIVKPMLYRFWMRGEAYRDAERIVRIAQGQSR